jgi:hypothetical protein
MNNVVIGQTVTSASGNTSGVAIDVVEQTTKAGEKITRVLVETDNGIAKWITLR